ncbi:MAG: hypothetical protein QXL96_01460 [Ignisphaera sp.]
MGTEIAREIKVYRNSDIIKIVAFIPSCHRHIRLVLITKDQAIVLHEATVAAIVRAYVDITTHPMRRAIEYNQVKLEKDLKKSGYADHQLIESDRAEIEIINEWSRILGFKKCTHEQ